jgi:hypothetical protein
MPAPGSSSGSESTCTAQDRYRAGMRAASLATRAGTALQNSLVCTPQLRTTQNPMAGASGSGAPQAASLLPMTAAPAGASSTQATARNYDAA